MTEEEIKLEAEKKAAFEEAQKNLKQKSVEDLVTIINDTRSEARDRRLKEKELEAELEKIRVVNKEEEEAKLLEDGKLQELIDSGKLELSNTQTEMDGWKTKAEEMEAFKMVKIQAAKKSLGNKWLDEYGNLSLTALDTLVSSMEAKSEIITDDGPSGEHVDIELTAEQKKDAEEKFPFAKTPERAWELHKHNLIKFGTIKPEK